MEQKNPSLIFSFAAAGWLQNFHYGVAKALQDVGIAYSEDDASNARFIGSSAGALAAAALVSKCNFDNLRDYAVNCSTTCRSSLLNACRIRGYVAEGIRLFAVERFRDDPALRAALNRDLEIYVSVLPLCRKKCISVFDEVEDLQEALVASCCLTPLAGLPFRLRDTQELVCDGGLTAFQPRKGEENVITVSAFYFNNADIKPSVFVPAWWGLYPPGEREYRQLYDQGYNDAIEYLVRSSRIDEKYLQLLKQPPPKRVPTTLDAVRDALAIFFMVFLRPVVLILIYGEMLLASGCLLAAAACMPRRKGHWVNWYHCSRNIISLRVLLHVVLGSHVPVNHQRLERHSRIYRVFRPILY